MGQHIYDKIINAHRIASENDDNILIYVDRHYIYEVSSPQAFDSIRKRKGTVYRSRATIATMDHNIPTKNRNQSIRDPLSKRQVEALAENCREFGICLYDLDHEYNGIIHVVFPELGYTQPGMVVACGDSHTLTHGALGALPIPVTSDIEHILTTQTVRIKKEKVMNIRITGKRYSQGTAKDIALYMIRQLGTDGAVGYMVEFTGSIVKSLSVEERMTLCNMSTEMGAKAAIISPDEKVYDYLEGRAHAPEDSFWNKAVTYWQTMKSDSDAVYDRRVSIDITDMAPQVSWGINPSQVIGIDETVPEIHDLTNEAGNDLVRDALAYMKLKPGQSLTDIPIDYVFIGSCTNGRIEDLRSAAQMLEGKIMHPKVTGIVVPGSGSVKKQAEAEGLAKIFTDAGFEWRQPGCSMCLGMNGDAASEGQTVASTSNRNFKNRQGKNVRTFLASPRMAAAAAVSGSFVDIRKIS